MTFRCNSHLGITITGNNIICQYKPRQIFSNDLESDFCSTLNVSRPSGTASCLGSTAMTNTFHGILFLLCIPGRCCLDSRRSFMQSRRGDFPTGPNWRTLSKSATKTIQRERDYMRYRLSLPIEFDYAREATISPSQQPTSRCSSCRNPKWCPSSWRKKRLEAYKGTAFEQPLRTALQELVVFLWIGTHSLTLIGNPVYVNKALLFPPLTLTISSEKCA